MSNKRPTPRDQAERMFAALVARDERPTEENCRKLGWIGSQYRMQIYRAEWVKRTGVKLPPGRKYGKNVGPDVPPAEVLAEAAELRANPLQGFPERHERAVDARTETQKAVDQYDQAKRRWRG